jgi:chemotaxis protein methyltransferase CheR
MIGKPGPPDGSPSISASDFYYIRTFLKQHSAISLDDGKEYLVSSRLMPLARDQGYDSVNALIGELRRRPFGKLHVSTVEALATTETSFFRDFHPFEALRTEVIPTLIRKRRATRTLNVWCAACSSGQEPHSLSILIKENFPSLETWNLQFFASDLSQQMIKKAVEGQYLQHEINRGLPASLLVRYFEQKANKWQLKAHVRGMFKFFQQNIIHDWGMIPPIDLLFLRNVLIYFDVATRRQLLRRIRRLLRPDGYLLLGTAETTLNLDDSFSRVKIGRSVFYQTERSGGP